jgi:DNA-binding NarL/FixJ family response regulator
MSSVRISQPRLAQEQRWIVALAERIAARWPKTRVLLVSGHTQDAALLGVPSLAFLHKPFSRDELARAVRRVLDV